MLLLEEAASIRIKQIVISSRHKTRKEHKGAFPKGAFGAKLNQVRNISSGSQTSKITTCTFRSVKLERTKVHHSLVLPRKHMFKILSLYRDQRKTKKSIQLGVYKNPGK